MRVKLKLQALARATRLPLNHNHAVSALIYQIISQSSAEYATALHQQGYQAEKGRQFKLFTHSRLEPGSRRRVGNEFILDRPDVYLQISSPVEAFVSHFVAGLFRSESFRVANAHFILEGAKTMPKPKISERMKFRALSPITESVRDERGGTRYLGLEDDWSEIICRNLMRKYEALYGRAPSDTRLKWTWDMDYVQGMERRGKRVSSLITITDKTGVAISVRGWMAPFTVEGSKELIELGYEAGFGNKGSMGFGMAEVNL